MPESVAIVGGGAAGIYAAIAVADGGARAVLFERNPRIGIKILISGGGKCNITHDVSPSDMEFGFVRSEARFLRYALHELTASAVIADLNGEGVRTHVRPNGRVFPDSGRAADVLAAFERMLLRRGVAVRTGRRVESVVVADGRASGVRVNGVGESFDAVIVATGGMSYRKVGTTGDGISWASELGLEVVAVRPALAPMYFRRPPPPILQGVALRDVSLSIEPTLKQVGVALRARYIEQWRDDILFTHRGVSGPAVLEVSRAAALAIDRGAAVRPIVDLTPDLTLEQLLALWNRRVNESPKSEAQSFVEMFVPKAVVPFALESAGIPSGTKIATVSREERSRLLATLKGWRLSEIGEIPLDRGEVTAGGVALTEVSPTTMESKRVRGLYFAGEALDIAGSVGGYNLQAAFATGFVAGRAAAGGDRSGRSARASHRNEIL